MSTPRKVTMINKIERPMTNIPGLLTLHPHPALAAMEKSLNSQAREFQGLRQNLAAPFNQTSHFASERT